MVESATTVWMCDSCLAEWAIEPEPSYPSWNDISFKEIDKDCIVCPFCGSESVSKK